MLSLEHIVDLYNLYQGEVFSFSLCRFFSLFPGEVLPTTHMVYLLSEGALLKCLFGLRTTGQTCRRIWGWKFVRFLQTEFWYACWGKFLCPLFLRLYKYVKIYSVEKYVNSE